MKKISLGSMECDVQMKKKIKKSTNETTERKDGALVLLDRCMPNELVSTGAGAMGGSGGVGVAGGVGSLRSNQDGARARRKKGGVGGGVGSVGHGSCTRSCKLSELNICWNGAGGGGGGGGERCDPPVS